MPATASLTLSTPSSGSTRSACHRMNSPEAFGNGPKERRLVGFFLLGRVGITRAVARRGIAWTLSYVASQRRCRRRRGLPLQRTVGVRIDPRELGTEQEDLRRVVDPEQQHRERTGGAEPGGHGAAT